MSNANQALTDLGYSVSSKLVRDDYDGHKGSHVHLVTISLGDKSMEVEYTSGCGNRTHPVSGEPPVWDYSGRLTVHDHEQNQLTVPNDPVLEDVMCNLLLDASSGQDAQSFEEFCDSFGYDDDSINALKIFEACHEQYLKMQQLGVDFEALDAILEDF